MDRRIELGKKLREILGSGNVYYQPPESKKMDYPCIVYHRSRGDIKFADDRPYHFTVCYELTVIDKDPDSEIVPKLAMSFPMIRFDRHYTADNLNHDVFTLFY